MWICFEDKLCNYFVYEVVEQHLSIMPHRSVMMKIGRRRLCNNNWWNRLVIVKITFTKRIYYWSIEVFCYTQLRCFQFHHISIIIQQYLWKKKNKYKETSNWLSGVFFSSFLSISWLSVNKLKCLPSRKRKILNCKCHS